MFWAKENENVSISFRTAILAICQWKWGHKKPHFLSCYDRDQMIFWTHHIRGRLGKLELED
jgi:hypothetical protein